MEVVRFRAKRFSFSRIRLKPKLNRHQKLIRDGNIISWKINGEKEIIRQVKKHTIDDVFQEFLHQFQVCPFQKAVLESFDGCVRDSQLG